MVMRRLWSQTIWARNAIPAAEYKYRNLKRVILPVYDLLVIVGGLAAWHNGVPAIQDLFDRHITTIASFGFMATGVSCLIGVSFPRLATLEIWSKIVAIGLLSSYVTALVAFTAVGDPNRGFVSVIALMSMLLPIWRITLLAAERTRRKAQDGNA